MESSSQISGGELFANLLNSKNVEKIFAISGAGNLALLDSLLKFKQVELIYCHHEQAAVMAAQGYSRISGKPGVVIVTTGGGTSNAVTGILSAHLDSVPVLIISGNESSYHCTNMENFRAYGVQGFNSIDVIGPISKLSVRIMDVNNIESIFHQSWNLMLDKRMGPVHIDFPMDLQRKPVGSQQVVKLPDLQESINSNVKLVNSVTHAEIVDLVVNSKKPIFYIGNGCRDKDTVQSILKIIETLNIPFVLSWSALDLIPDNHRLNIGRIGIYGDRGSNILLQQSDLIVCIGTRLAIPQTGFDKNDFGRVGQKVVIDVDPIELSKFNFVNWKVHLSESKEFFSKLIKSISELSISKKDEDWLKNCKYIINSLLRIDQINYSQTDHDKYLHSFDVIEFLNKSAKSPANIVTDVGAGLLTGHYGVKIKDGQRIFTSQGLGEMGFGLPGAIGAYFAEPETQLICLNTDGGIMFNLQELELIDFHKIPIKLFIFNNSGYSMIKISQSNLFNSRFSGSDFNSGISFPNFEKIASTFDLQYIRLNSKGDLNESVVSLLSSENAVLFEIIMDPNQKYLPRLSTAKGSSGALISPPLEDLDPLLEIGALEKYLGYKPLKQSFEIRNLSYE
jgi:acetolactate synthase-1/2/3 large subunit